MPPQFERRSLLRVSLMQGARPSSYEPFRSYRLFYNLRWWWSACDHHFLIEAAEERFLADANVAAGKPFGDFVTPQIERKGFQSGQQRSPKVAQRMPPH